MTASVSWDSCLQSTFAGSCVQKASFWQVMLEKKRGRECVNRKYYSDVLVLFFNLYQPSLKSISAFPIFCSNFTQKVFRRNQCRIMRTKKWQICSCSENVSRLKRQKSKACTTVAVEGHKKTSMIGRNSNECWGAPN